MMKPKKCLSVFLLLFSLAASAQEPVLKVDVISEPAIQSEIKDVPADPWSERVMVDFSTAPKQENEQQDTGDSLFFIDLQLRGRGEYRNGQGSLRKHSQQPAWFVGDRERLVFGFKRGVLSAKLSGQHTGVWGDQGLEGNGSSFSLNEVWARLDARNGMFLQVGRQVLSYDDERIFGAEDWSSKGYSHDVVRLGYEHGMHKIHGVLGFNQLGEKRIGGTYYDGAMPYKSLQFLWYHYGDDSKPLQFSVMGMNEGLEIGSKTELTTSDKTGFMQLVGGWLQYAPSRFYAKAEGYYQLGHDQSQRAMSAFMAGGRAGWKDAAWGASAGVDYLSGAKRYNRKEANKCFNLLFGSNHNFYGAMDYFYPGRTLQCGLMDVVVSGYYCPVSKLTLDVTYHDFLTGVKRTNINRQLGHEIDIKLRYDILKDVWLEAGYSMVLPTESLVYFRDGSADAWQDWGWISISFSPRLFKTGARK